MIIWGQVKSTSIKLFKENLTTLEWEICQLHGAESQNTPIEKECKLEQL